MKKTILVTGGAGYIGSHTCKALERAGYLPVAYDNLVYGHRWAVKWGPLEEGDIGDRTRLDAVLRQYAPVAAIHFAAFAYVGESVGEPSKYWHNNVGGSLSLLDALRDHGTVPVVFSSSCATYGVPPALPIRETTPQNPINPYGMTKLTVERMLLDFDAAYGLRHVALRYFNAAGADRDGEIGEDHDPETHVIPLLLRAVADAGSPLKVFGTDFPTPDGTAIRDYVHVEDLAAAHVAALNRLLDGGASARINVGTGKGTSVGELVAVGEQVTGRTVHRQMAPRRAGDPPELVADVSQLKPMLGLRPESFASIQDVVRTAWAWHQKHHAK